MQRDARLLRILVVPALYCLISAWPVAAQDAPNAAIWDKPILKQPFDKDTFYQVKIPQWVRETMGAGYTLSGGDFESRKRAAEAGVTLSEMGFVDPFFTYYDSKLLTKRSPHVPPDKLEKDIAEYRQLGIRVLGVYPPCLQGEVWEKHPEWRRIAEYNGAIPEMDLVKYPHGGMLCPLGPYGDFMIDVLCEIEEKFKVDAFSFDGLHYGGFCYCQHCREAYRKETGGEIPKVDLEDPAFRNYQHWADRRMERTIQKMQERLKAINPDCALVTWTTNAGRFGHFRDIPRNMPARMNLLFDAPDQEFWLDETNRGNTIVPAIANSYIWAVTNHRVAFSEPYLMSHGNPYGKDSFPPHEIKRRMMLALTWGAVPSLAVSQPPHLQAAAYEGVGMVRERKPWVVDRRPEPWAAVVLSDNTRVMYGRSSGQVEDRYLANVFGTFRAAAEEHLPFALINDWNLNPEDLKAYKVLVLPNTACLNDAQVAAVREYVRAGGGLVASLDASMYDDLGTPRADFGLGEVFGLKYEGLVKAGDASKDELDINFLKGVDPAYWEKRKQIFDLKLADGGMLDVPELRGLLGTSSVVYKGAAVQVAPLSAEVQSAGTIQPTGGAGAAVPAAVTRTFGQGRVVYLPAAFDAAYYLYPYPYHRELLRRAIEWAAGGAPPVQVEAPMCVHAVTFCQSAAAGTAAVTPEAPAGERLLVYLFNNVNTAAQGAKPEDDTPLREELIPIHDIKIRLRGYPVGRVHLEPGNTELVATASGDGVEITVPKLEMQSIVVVDLK